MKNKNKLSQWICKITGRLTERSKHVLKEAGFTLIEMMIVLAIIALVMGFVGTNVIRKYDQSRVDATKIQMKQLGVILDDFRRVCGYYPSTEQGLDALVKAPTGGRQCKNYDPEGFLKKVPQDAWNNDFVYISDGSKYTLKSLGADGKEGGDGFNKDISSDEL
jgi:general secretion pathway protein G